MMKEKVKEMLRNEGIVFSTESKEEFLSFLEAVQEDTSIFEVDIYGLKILDCEGDGLMIEENVGEIHPISSFGVTSLEEKLIGSPRSVKLPREKFIEALEIFKYASKEGDYLQALHRGGKIQSFNSKNYKFLDQRRLAASFLAAVPDRSEFLKGIFTHHETYIKVVVKDPSIMEEYHAIGKKYRKYFEEMVPILEFRTSDVGMRSASVSCYLQSERGMRFPLGNNISSRHTGEVTEEVFEESLKGLFASIKDLTAKVTELFSIPIQNPLRCIGNVAKVCQLNKEETFVHLDLFASMYEGEDIQFTAYDVYNAVNEIIFSMASDPKRGADDSRILSAYENVRRVLDRKSWGAYDKAHSLWFI